MGKLNITICGCGNGAHACAVLMGNMGHTVNIFSPLENEIDEFIKQGNYELEGLLPDSSIITTKLNKITSNAKEVIPNSSIIFVIVPAFAHENVLRHISDYIKKDALLVTIPTRSGFEFQANDILNDVNIIGLQTLPWACRIEEFGKRIKIIGKKIEMQIATMPSKISEIFVYQLEQLLDIKLEVVQSMLTLTLGNVGQIIHPGITYGIFRDNPDAVYKEEEIPLFYQGVNKSIGDILQKLSDEIQLLTKTIYAKNNNIINPKEVLSIDKWILKSYGDQIIDKSSLDKMFSSNLAYQGLTAPVIEVQTGSFSPNYKTRYILEDIPYGLLIIKAIAQIVDVQTPQIDEVIKTLGSWVGEDYYNSLEIVNKIATISRIPILHGVVTLDDLEKVYL